MPLRFLNKCPCVFAILVSDVDNLFVVFALSDDTPARTVRSTPPFLSNWSARRSLFMFVAESGFSHASPTLNTASTACFMDSASFLFL